MQMKIECLFTMSCRKLLLELSAQVELKGMFETCPLFVLCNVLFLYTFCNHTYFHASNWQFDKSFLKFYEFWLSQNLL